MKKKILMALSIAAVAFLTIGGTIAYLADETKVAKNVFTVGEAKITQNEYTLDETGKEIEFVQNEQLLPGMSQDKIVKVENIGEIDVYYRTIIAVEAPENARDSIIIKKNTNNNIVWTKVDGYTTIEDAEYQLYVATYQEALAATEVSEASLLAVEMARTVTNETIVLFGENVDVLVVSQAVQTEEFENAEDALNTVFGKVSTVYNPWSEKTSGQEGLESVIESSDEKVVVALETGEYSLNNINLSNKEVTIAGTEDTVIDMTTNTTNTSGASITFDGVTVEYSNSNYTGFTHSEKVVYKNTTIRGTQFLYAEEVEFINCTFEMLDETTEYNVWTYGSKNVTFTNCTFNTGGKAVLVYVENEHHADITLNNCVFNSNGTVSTSKAAVEVGASAYSDASTYNLTFNNCVANGFVENNSTSPLWGNKNSMDQDHLNVIIDGVDVY